MLVVCCIIFTTIIIIIIIIIIIYLCSVIAAAGNAGNSGLLYPAAYPSVIAVAAVDADGIRPAFSQCNDQVEIAAP